MKKFYCLILALSFVLPAFAVNDTNAELQKAEAKYQAKLEKIKQKQEIKCIKHPEYCSTSPIKETQTTLGTAQKYVKIGMSQDQVAMYLGSPNIVTTDSDGRETWIYDKMSSVTSYNDNGFAIGANIILAGVGKTKTGGSVQTSQKTLTIVIKFKNQKVESFQYHMSTF